MSLKILHGDITDFEGDAIVNAANSSLLGGGGVDGAIHYKAGPELKEECRKLKGCRTGEAKITKGYRLKAKFVIHTVGPVFYEHSHEEARNLLEKCYRNSIEAAEKNGCKTVAFPLISAGVYGYPKKEALETAVDSICKYGKNLDCSIVLFDGEACMIAKDLFADLWIN